VNAPHPGGSSIGAIHARLLALHPKRIDLSLGRIQRLLAALGHPERHLPPVIHVAGTNGKGSTVAFARAILEAAGKRAHVYTSPNLVRLNERFRIARTGGGKFVEREERHLSQFRRRKTTKCDSEKLTRKLARIATALASQTGKSRISAANKSVAVLTSNPATPEATNVR